MSEAVRAGDTEIVAVDNSAPMIDAFRRRLDGLDETGLVPIRLRCEDVCETEIDRASVVVLNFTLQFIEPAARTGAAPRRRAGAL